jgi:hypothetical protein
MLLDTPDTIRTLLRKLCAKAKQETGHVAQSKVECTGGISSGELGNMSRGSAHALVLRASESRVR